MIRTGDEYRESIRDAREVWIDGERVTDVTTHPALKPIVDARARIYDLAHEPATRDVMSYVDAETGERCPTGSKLPSEKEDWYAKRAAVDTVLDDLNGIVTRVGDETVGEMWSLYDGQDVLNEINPAFSEHIREHVRRAALGDPFHVSANTDPKGDRSKRPQDQDPDVLLRVVGENSKGIILRGAKFETAAAYANQAFVKPTIGDWGNVELSDYAVGFIADMAAPGIKHICRSSFAGRASSAEYPLSNSFDEVDVMIIFDDVEIPWENVLFYRHTSAAAFIRATLHRYSMFPFVQRHLRFADLLVGLAYTNAVQTGVKMHQGVREKIAQLVCYREGINAHLTAAVELAERSPGGLLMPNQQLLYTGRVLACSQLPAMMHLARELCGGQLCVTPAAACFEPEETAPWLEKYLSIGNIEAEERRRLFAFARDLLNSDYAGHRLTFQLFAQAPPFAHLLAVYNNYDFEHPADLVRRYAGLENGVDATSAPPAIGSSAVGAPAVG
jgi:4-hydroxyphenylacetate 3-monooxygenase